jgi:glycosyltransferase involved in cell wall biosynthesis
VISSANPCGGGPIAGVLQSQSPLQELGVHTEIATCDSPSAPWLTAGELPIHALGPPVLDYAYAPRLRAWLRRNVSQYDAVIVDGIWQYHSYAVWLALRGTTSPYYVFPHGMLGPWFKKTYPLKHLKKWAYWPWADYRVLRDAKRVLFTCDRERLLARDSFWLYRANEAVVGLGISEPPSLDDRVPRPRPVRGEGRRMVLFLGRIHRIKGCDILLEAFAQVAARDGDLHLVFAGPDQGGLQPALRERAIQLGIENRVSWPGMLDEQRKWQMIESAEVLCLPSHHENFGMVVAEAMACGKPVLISDKVNICEEVRADCAGFVDEDSVDGTRRNLERWLSMDAGEYEDMCRRAHESFKSRFRASIAAQRLVHVIRTSAE